MSFLQSNGMPASDDDFIRINDAYITTHTRCRLCCLLSAQSRAMAGTGCIDSIRYICKRQGAFRAWQPIILPPFCRKTTPTLSSTACLILSRRSRCLTVSWSFERRSPRFVWLPTRRNGGRHPCPLWCSRVTGFCHLLRAARGCRAVRSFLQTLVPCLLQTAARGFCLLLLCCLAQRAARRRADRQTPSDSLPYST